VSAAFNPDNCCSTLVTMGKRIHNELPHLAKLIVRTCSLDQPNHSFQAYAVSIEEMNSRSEGRCWGVLEKNNRI
jgi:hypothetical protein